MTSRTILNRSGESEHPYLVPELRGKAFSVSPLNLMLNLDFSVVFTMSKYVSSIPSLLWVFNHKNMLNFVKCFFCTYWDNYNDFYPSFCYFSLPCCFLCGCWTILASPESIPFDHGVWSLSVYCWIWFVNILFRIFASVFIKDIGL